MSSEWVPVAAAGVGAAAAIAGSTLSGWQAERRRRRQEVERAVGLLTSYPSQMELVRGTAGLLEKTDENLRWRADKDIERMHDLHRAVATLQLLGDRHVGSLAQDLYICISTYSGDIQNVEVRQQMEKANRDLLAVARAPRWRRRRADRQRRRLPAQAGSAESTIVR